MRNFLGETVLGIAILGKASLGKGILGKGILKTAVLAKVILAGRALILLKHFLLGHGSIDTKRGHGYPHHPPVHPALNM